MSAHTHSGHLGLAFSALRTISIVVATTNVRLGEYLQLNVKKIVLEYGHRAVLFKSDYSDARLSAWYYQASTTFNLQPWGPKVYYPTSQLHTVTLKDKHWMHSKASFVSKDENVKNLSSARACMMIVVNVKMLMCSQNWNQSSKLRPPLRPASSYSTAWINFQLSQQIIIYFYRII